MIRTLFFSKLIYEKITDYNRGNTQNIFRKDLMICQKEETKTM